MIAVSFNKLKVSFMLNVSQCWICPWKTCTFMVPPILTAKRLCSFPIISITLMYAKLVLDSSIVRDIDFDDVPSSSSYNPALNSSSWKVRSRAHSLFFRSSSIDLYSLQPIEKLMTKLAVRCSHEYYRIDGFLFERQFKCPRRIFFYPFLRMKLPVCFPFSLWANYRQRLVPTLRYISLQIRSLARAFLVYH